MPRSEPISNYITLGQFIYLLSNPRAVGHQVYLDSITPFFQYLEACGFPAARAAAAPLNGIRITHVHGVISDPGGLAVRMQAVVETLTHEAKDRRIIKLDTSAVSTKLRQLHQSISLNETQQRLRDEAVLSIECGVYRAAVIVGWSLAYDCIRRWMWEEPTRRTSFNNELMTWTGRGGAPRYPAGLAEYEDFWTIRPPLGEWEVLEAMRDSGLFGGVTADKLVHYLRERNGYAHANDLSPSIHQVNHYLDDLVDMITRPPFK